MPVQCVGCKAYLAISSIAECPRCGTPLPPSNPPQLATKAAGVGSSVDGVRLVIGGMLVLLCGFLFFRMAVPSDEQVHNRKVAQALLGCQQTLVKLAEFGDAETPPFTENHGSGGEFYFAWAPGAFYFKNGFGASVKMSASCIGDVSTGKIKQLTLNGRDVL